MSMKSSGAVMEPSLNERKKLTNSEVGMFVTMASFAMLFGTLLLSYLLIRARQSVWPPIGIDQPDALLPTISTAVLLGSSWLLHESTRRRLHQLEVARSLWMGATVLGFLFMSLQLWICWQWSQSGIHAGDSLFASIIYTLIGVHLAHAIASWGTLVWIFFRKRSWTHSQSEAPRMVAWFWHFLDAVWIITFALIFVG
jgi:cytochrome c oxidase subunit III